MSTASDHPRAPAGLRVGDYELITRIGEGGMGVVHLARRPGGERVALKVLRPHIVGDDEARARLAREVSSLSRVRSSWVAAIVDADPWGEIPYVAMRYVPGLSLHDHVKKEGALEGAELVRFAGCLAEALASVHDVGVLHRDVKPSNVLLEGRNPILIDFGLARVADDPKLTHTGWLLGTPGYLAPEILYGDDATAASDVHSWAATVGYAALGRAPFGRGPAMAIMDRVRRGDFDLEELPPRLAELLGHALAPDPADRPTLPELRERLRPGGQELYADDLPYEDDWNTAGSAEPTVKLPEQPPAPPQPAAEDPFTLPLALAQADQHGGPADADSCEDAVATSESATRQYTEAVRPTESLQPDPYPPPAGGFPPVGAVPEAWSARETTHQRTPGAAPDPAPQAFTPPPRDEPYQQPPPPRQDPVLPDYGQQPAAFEPAQQPYHPWPQQPQHDPYPATPEPYHQQHVPVGYDDRAGQQPYPYDPYAEPPRPVPAIERLRRGSLIVALGLACGVAVMAAPWVATTIIVVLVWLLRSICLAGDSIGYRRSVRGVRWYDGIQVVLASPWHLLQGIPGTLILVLWAAGAGAVGALLAYAVAAGTPIIAFLGGLGLGVGLWCGPGGSRLRRPVQAIVRGLSLRGVPWAVAIALVLGGSVAGALTVESQGMSWAPSTESPIGR